MTNESKAYKTRQTNRLIRHGLSTESSDKLIGKIEPGIELFCLNKGQFSIINVIESILKQTGSANVIISTWTAANAEISIAEKFLENGNINKLHWIVDRSFKTRQPKYYDLLIEKFGDNVVSETNSHSKFVLVYNDDWSIVIRTSMNLNENKRMEFFELSDSKPLFDYVFEICSDIMGAGAYEYTKFEKLGSDKKYDDYRLMDQLERALNG